MGTNSGWGGEPVTQAGTQFRESFDTLVLLHDKETRDKPETIWATWCKNDFTLSFN